jgi:hypothetical protein
MICLSGSPGSRRFCVVDSDSIFQGASGVTIEAQGLPCASCPCVHSGLLGRFWNWRQAVPGDHYFTFRNRMQLFTHRAERFQGYSVDSPLEEMFELGGSVGSFKGWICWTWSSRETLDLRRNGGETGLAYASNPRGRQWDRRVSQFCCVGISYERVPEYDAMSREIGSKTRLTVNMCCRRHDLC